MAKKTITLFYGGDTNIGRRMNFKAREVDPFVNIAEMKSADIRLVNLECVIATKGEAKNEITEAYIRARPEMTNILVNADIDIVLTANNHAGDYGTEALLEEIDYLDEAGILHAGSGKNFDEAFAPVYKKVGDIVLAIFSVDTTRRSSAATVDNAGTAYLPTDNLELWKETFAEKIRLAHETAHAVIVCPHWNVSGVESPSEEVKQLGHLLIDLGADAVLGCSSNTVHGVENYKARPIIYDAGYFLFDWGRRNGGCFTLDISSDGVEKVKFIPLVVRYRRTLHDKDSAEEIQKNFVELCNEFNTATTVSADNIVEMSFKPAPRESKPVNDFADVPRAKKLIEPLAEPRPEWIVDKVPDEAIIKPQHFGALKLVGYYVPPDCRIMTENKPLHLETYWTIDEPVEESYLLSIGGVPVRECLMPAYGSGQEHDFLDYMYPTNRWKVGVIYREKFNLLPPARRLANVNLRMEVVVSAGKEALGQFTDSDLIRMRLSDLTQRDMQFDDIIYQSKPGKCWTAEQLAKVTGGKWIVPPPEGWYVQNFNKLKILGGDRPRMMVIDTPNANLARQKILDNIDNVDAALIACNVGGLPPNFPLLKVKAPTRAAIELGFAARKRFQGRVIAVTGSAGKTTTCNMLNHVLSKDHSVTATPGSSNMYGVVPRIFANVKQDDAFAIIEMSIDAFEKTPGSICYELMPHVAVVTSITSAHIGRRGSLEVIATNKSRIFNGMSPGGYAILNRDMPCYEIFAEKAKSFKLNIITFGTHPDSDVRMPVLEVDGEFFAAGKTYRISCPVPVEQLYDALAVVAVSIAVGFSIEKALDYLKTFEVVKGRGNIIETVRYGKNLRVIDSTGSATFLSMKYAIEYLKDAAPNQKSRVAILGDIARLGVQSVETHKQLAETMLEVEPDRLLLCGEFMRYPYEIVKDKLNAVWFETLDELLKNVDLYLRDGDTILVKSSIPIGLVNVVRFLTQNAL